MDTVLVQINNVKAYRLLEDLEDLQIIKVLKSKGVSKKKISDKYSGSIPSKLADELQKIVSQSREEWNKKSI